jgi:aryl-alcohol dehydrogenase-like predicted oxidoreductase
MTCVHKALDLGINLSDTANIYGRGAAESVLGEALAEFRATPTSWRS